MCLPLSAPATFFIMVQIKTICWCVLIEDNPPLLNTYLYSYCVAWTWRREWVSYLNESVKKIPLVGKIFTFSSFAFLAWQVKLPPRQKHLSLFVGRISINLSRREAVIDPLLSLEGSTSGLLTFNRARHGRQEDFLFLEARRLRTILRLTPKVMTLCPIAYLASDRTQLVFILSVLGYVLKASNN